MKIYHLSPYCRLKFFASLHGEHKYQFPFVETQLMKMQFLKSFAIRNLRCVSTT